jgi:UDP-3-O-acyl N-acetylglycosamine deacetylase
MPAPEFQHTVGKTASFSGTALHTGDKVTLKLQPAPVDHGIKFKRKDLQDEPTIDAKIENLKTVERATTIGEGSVRVHTVEHILSALSAMGVDNAIVEMDANRRRQRAALCRIHQKSRRNCAGRATKIFRRARADARGNENRRPACFAPG